jgi:twitching motility protein PilT
MTVAEGFGHIDQLLKIFGSQNSGTLKLEAGSPPRVVGAAGDSRDLSGRVLSRQEILAIVGPIVPEHARRQLPKEPSVSFDYATPAVGLFKVTMARDSERLIVTIVSESPGASAPEPGLAAPPLAAAVPAPPPVRAAVPAAAPPPVRAAVPAAAPPPSILSAGHPIDRLFRAMAGAGASDLHLTVGMPPLIRKDGRIQPLEDGQPPLDPATIGDLLRPIIPDKNANEYAARHDTDFAYEIVGLARFRANVFVDRKGPGAVFRVIPSKILTAEELGLSPVILQLCGLTKGLVLVTGPTGSGKSTTLCAMVDYINRKRDDHIITIEDPIEFVHENRKCLINQREVGTHTDSFKGALRAALREDPDIVLVGELRDLETVAIAIETAETGHLVFGTLHTTTAASTVDRVIDQFPSDRQSQIRVMLSESLRGVISQTLCRKIGGGRLAALEVLIITSAISNLIREGKTFQINSMMQVGKALGMVGLNDALMDLVTKKLVAPEEAYAKSVDRTSFEGLLKRAGIDTKFVLGVA